MPAESTVEPLYVPDRATWRAWLAANHTTSPGVWLLIHKKGNPEPSVGYEEAVEEALCFGWIDGLMNPIDAMGFKQWFTRRSPKSVWSKSNKERVARLIEQGLMTPAGLAVIELAKQNGTWTAYDDIEQLVVPDDFAAALSAEPDALTYWNAFSKSVKKGILYFIQSAKRPETRAKRIARTVELAAQNIRINFDQP